MNPDVTTCPFCGETIKDATHKCRFPEAAPATGPGAATPPEEEAQEPSPHEVQEAVPPVISQTTTPGALELLSSFAQKGRDALGRAAPRLPGLVTPPGIVSADVPASGPAVPGATTPPDNSPPGNRASLPDRFTTARTAWRTAWTTSPLLALLVCFGSVVLLLLLQVWSGPLLWFWPFLLVAPVAVSLLRGPLWGCLAALLAAAGQMLLPWFIDLFTGLSGLAAVPGENSLSAGTGSARETDWSRLAACVGAGFIAAIGTFALRQRHTAQRDEAQISRAQLRLATVTSDPSSLPALLNAAVREVAELTGRGVCGLLLWDAPRGCFTLAQQSAPGGHPLPSELSLEPEQIPALQKAMQTRTPQVAEFAGIAAAPPLPSALLVPLVNWGRVLGCLFLGGGVRSTKAARDGKGKWSPAPFTQREIEVAAGFAGQVAVALENTRLYNEILTQKELLAAEQERSERLLLNILPAPIVQRLKRDPSVIADSFADVTVLFADIVDFTPLSASLSAQSLVSLLNQVFSVFDRLSLEHGLEKIKTIGDAYMVVGGLPQPREDHAEAVARMALAMQREVAGFRRADGAPLSLRIGIHSGPVVAGVIGTSKFIYDLWGDTVNTASRMESHGLAGGIQVTQAAYELLREQFVFEERGLMQIKGKGSMRAYLLLREQTDQPGTEPPVQEPGTVSAELT